MENALGERALPRGRHCLTKAFNRLNMVGHTFLFSLSSLLNRLRRARTRCHKLAFMFHSYFNLSNLVSLLSNVSLLLFDITVHRRNFGYNASYILVINLTQYDIGLTGCGGFEPPITGLEAVVFPNYTNNLLGS